MGTNISLSVNTCIRYCRNGYAAWVAGGARFLNGFVIKLITSYVTLYIVSVAIDFGDRIGLGVRKQDRFYTSDSDIVLNCNDCVTVDVYGI